MHLGLNMNNEFFQNKGMNSGQRKVYEIAISKLTQPDTRVNRFTARLTPLEIVILKKNGAVLFDKELNEKELKKRVLNNRNNTRYVALQLYGQSKEEYNMRVIRMGK